MIISENAFSCLGDICEFCNCFDCACLENDLENHNNCDTENDSINGDSLTFHKCSNLSLKKTCNQLKIKCPLKNEISIADDQSKENLKVHSDISIQKCSASTSFNLKAKGLNFGHLNVQGICGKNMCKFSEIKALLTAPENSSLHIFGISETKLKPHKMSTCFTIDGFQTPFRKDNDSNGGGGIMVYVRNGINATRRSDLETNNISCIWLEITIGKGKPFLVGNMYRPPDSRIEFNDRFESFMDIVSMEGKEIILLGDRKSVV